MMILSIIQVQYEIARQSSRTSKKFAPQPPKEQHVKGGVGSGRIEMDGGAVCFDCTWSQ